MEAPVLGLEGTADPEAHCNNNITTTDTLNANSEHHVLPYLHDLLSCRPRTILQMRVCFGRVGVALEKWELMCKQVPGKCIVSEPGDDVSGFQSTNATPQARLPTIHYFLPGHKQWAAKKKEYTLVIKGSKRESTKVTHRHHINQPP